MALKEKKTFTVKHYTRLNLGLGVPLHLTFSTAMNGNVGQKSKQPVAKVLGTLYRILV